MAALLPQPLVAPARRRRLLLIFVAGAFVYLTTWNLLGHQSPFSPVDEPTSPLAREGERSLLAANSTLGFGTIVAISKPDSPRRHRLLQAANVTGLEITIPSQKVVTDEQLAVIQAQSKDLSKGSALAWLGHHNALKWFLRSGLETVLILEDDVDWDIHLRSVQVPVVASTVRGLLGEDTPIAKNYWGSPNQWDLLYLGHCGDYFGMINADGIGKHSPEELKDLDHEILQDSSLPVQGDLHPYTAQLLKDFGLQDHERLVHRSRFPLCTFGYAVTRNGAQRLLSDLTPIGKPESPAAFDIAILEACRKGENVPSPTPSDQMSTGLAPGLRCWTINPELFHHTPGKSMIAGVNENLGTLVGIPPVDATGYDQVIRRNETVNIGCGFWGDGFSFPDGDMAELARLKEEVGTKGKCIKTKFGNLDP